MMAQDGSGGWFFTIRSGKLFTQKGKNEPGLRLPLAEQDYLNEHLAPFQA